MHVHYAPALKQNRGWGARAAWVCASIASTPTFGGPPLPTKVSNPCYQADAWADKEKQADRHASQKTEKQTFPRACNKLSLTTTCQVPT